MCFFFQPKDLQQEIAQKNSSINYLRNALKDSREKAEREARDNALLRERLASLEEDNLRLLNEREQAKAGTPKAIAQDVEIQAEANAISRLREQLKTVEKEKFTLLIEKMSTTAEASKAMADRDELLKALEEEKEKKKEAEEEIVVLKVTVHELLSDLSRRDSEQEEMKSANIEWRKEWNKKQESMRMTLKESQEQTESLLKELRIFKQRLDAKNLAREHPVEQTKEQLSLKTEDKNILRPEIEERDTILHLREEELETQMEHAEETRDAKEEEIQKEQQVDTLVEEKNEIKEEEKDQKKAGKTNEPEKREEKKAIETKEKKQQEKKGKKGIFRRFLGCFSF